MKRIACCILNTRGDRVKPYAFSLISQMSSVVERVYIVVQQDINENDLFALKNSEKCIILVTQFEWSGWAFRSALENIGREGIRDIEELILFQSDCFGPVCSVECFLENMEQKQGDFWALSNSENLEMDSLYSKDGLCSVMGFRKTLLQNEAFWSCLSTMKPGWNETAFAVRDEFNLFDQLEKRGFRGDTLFDPAEEKYEGEMELIIDRLIERKRCPWIPLELFENLMGEQRRYYTDAAQFRRMLQWIRNEGLFDERLIWSELLPRMKLSELRKGFQLIRLLPEGERVITKKNVKKAAIIYLPSEWHAVAYFPFIYAFCNAGSSAVLCYRDESIRKRLETEMESVPGVLSWKKIDGTAESIVGECLVQAEDIIRQSEYVCCLLDYPLQVTKYVVTYEQHEYQQVDTLLRDEQRVNEIIQLFEQEKCLGIIDVMPQIYGEYYNMVGALVDQAHIGRIKSIYEGMKVPCPFDDDDDLLPAVFWSRAVVLEEALRYFKEKCIFQAVGKEVFAAGYVIHRCAQSQGYYPVRVITAEGAMSLVENQREIIREINRKAMDCTRVRNWDYCELMNAAEHAGITKSSDQVPITMGFRDVIHVNLSYIKRKIPDLLHRWVKNVSEKAREIRMDELPQFSAYLVEVERDGKRIRFTVMSDEAELDDCWLCIGVRKFYSKKALCTDCYKDGIPAKSVAVFEVPQEAFSSHGAKLRTQNGKLVGLKWLNRATKERKSKKEIVLEENTINLRKKSTPDLACKRDVKRLGIYFFYDAQGVVDEYVTYYLRAFRPLCTETCVVVNGKLNEEGRKSLQSVCDRLIVRENVGFDSQAYKKAILSYGYSQIAEQYDELVLHNFTNFGPIFPFEEMMDQMSSRECDFWGHCRYIAHENEKMGEQQVVDHLMSYFLTFKKPILQSDAFRQYWDTLRAPTNYTEAVVFHEMRCTQYFEKLGFISDAYMSSDKYCDKGNAPVFCPYKQLVEDRSPLLKRKVFFVKDGHFAFQAHFEEPSVYELIEYIRDHTDYDAMMIFKNIERTQDLKTDARNGKRIQNYTPFSYIRFLISCEKK